MAHRREICGTCVMMSGSARDMYLIRVRVRVRVGARDVLG